MHRRGLHLARSLAARRSDRGRHTITFAPAVTGTITLQASLGELPITDNTIIIGPGARVLAISAANVHRVFNFSFGGSSVSGLTIRDGSLPTTQNHGEPRQGGAIYNATDLTLTDCTLTSNSIIGTNNLTNGGAGGAAQGGAIFRYREPQPQSM